MYYRNICLVITALVILFFTSCEEQIELDLNEAGPRLVVEGGVFNSGFPAAISLSRTTSYFNNQLYNPENNAIVTITDNTTGTTSTCSEFKGGIFQNGGLYVSTLFGTANHNYTLIIRTQDGNTYTANNTMQDSVRIDSLISKIRPPRLNENPDTIKERIVTCHFTDPSPTGNYYGFRWTHKGVTKEIAENRVIEDKFTNGNPMFINFRNNITVGDTVEVQLVAFNKITYDFYNTLRRSLQNGSPFSTPPDNPVTNLNNNAMGFFGCYAITTRKVVVK